MYKMNPVIHSTYEVPTTVTLYRTASSVSDANSHFFVQFAHCLYTYPKQIARNVKVRNEKRSSRFKHNLFWPKIKYHLYTCLENWHMKWEECLEIDSQASVRLERIWSVGEQSMYDDGVLKKWYCCFGYIYKITKMIEYFFVV